VVDFLIAAFFASWQAQTLLGLIFLDVVLGIACAIRQGAFDWAKVANFYRSMVIPYILGYLALYVAIGFVIPPEAGEDLGGFVNQAAVTAAWVVLVANLAGSISKSFKALYHAEVPANR
jgi:hypothetical protein